MRIQTVTMSPTDAEALLERSADTRQRRLDPNRVRLYADKMRAGKWLVTHQPIGIAPDGTLFDGQHRVSAIVRAGIPVTLTVAYDADPETFDVVDVGRTRTPGQILAIAGYANTNILAAAVRYYALFSILEGTRALPSVDIRSSISPADVVGILETETGERILGSLTDATRVAQALGRPGMKTWLTALFAKLHDADHVLRAEFIDRLESGVRLDANSPILRLRRWLTSEYGYNRARSDLRGISGYGAAVKTWNAWINGEEIAQLTFKPGHERLPEIRLHRDTLDDLEPIPALEHA